jgi:hypothetical protein
MNNKDSKKNRKSISVAQRALDMLEVQNTMSKHAYYHAAGLHLEELADIWVKEDGPYARTAKWTNPHGIQDGLALIKKNYGTYHFERKKELLAELSKIYPELKNTPENIGAGSEWAMHTQTTAIIEVASDGKTAKGLWYSPGIMQALIIKDGKVDIHGGWFWEKYGVDFVKEGSKWKIWHIQMCYDNTPPGWGSHPPEGEENQMVLNLQMSRENPDPYKPWSPTSVPKIQPRFPEPYYTFDETFSY